MAVTTKKAGRTHIVMLLDRSGSMNSIKEDMEGAINRYIAEQQAVEGECTFTFAQFDHTYEVLLNAVDIQEVGEVTIEPRGSTALYDAMGRVLVSAGAHIRRIPKPKRPVHKLITIITDGGENASQEWRRKEVFDLVTEMEGDGWTIVYLGANQDAMSVGASLGTRSATTMTYAASSEGTRNVMASHSLGSTALRTAGAYTSFSDDDRKAATQK